MKTAIARTVAKGDHFTKLPNFAMSALSNRKRLWTSVYIVLSSRRQYQDDTYKGSYNAIRANLAAIGEKVSYEGLRNILRQLESLGLIARDNQINQASRRLVIKIRTGLTQSIAGLIQAIRNAHFKLTNSKNNRPPQRENRVESNRPDQQRYQMPPSESSFQSKTSGNSPAATKARAELLQLRSSFRRT